MNRNFPVSVSMDLHTLNILDNLAETLMLTRSAFIRELIHEANRAESETTPRRLVDPAVAYEEEA